MERRGPPVHRVVAKARDAPHHVPLCCIGVAWTVVSVALRVLRPVFCKFVGGVAHCDARPDGCAPDLADLFAE